MLSSAVADRFNGLTAFRHISPTAKRWRVKLCTYNIESSRLYVDATAVSHPARAWRPQARAEMRRRAVNEIIRDYDPDIFLLQEMPRHPPNPELPIDAIHSLATDFRNAGYGVILEPYNPTRLETLHYLTAYDRLTFDLEKHYARYMSKTPTSPTPRTDFSAIKANNFGVEWERCISVAEFRHKPSGEMIAAINVHLDMAVQQRLAATPLVLRFARQILDRDPTARVIIAGDFNTIPGQGDIEQMALTAGLVHPGTGRLLMEATARCRLETGEIANATYMPLPHTCLDLDPVLDIEQLAQVCFHPRLPAGKLDRVFGWGFDHIDECTVRPAPMFPLPEGFSFNDELLLKAYMLSHYAEGPALVSEHQPITATFSFGSRDEMSAC